MEVLLTSYFTFTHKEVTVSLKQSLESGSSFCMQLKESSLNKIQCIQW